MKKEEKVLSNDGELGQMEIDYVKVYQRHPEWEGRTEICSTPPAIITGPDVMCGTTAYGTSPTTIGGTWSRSNDAVTFGGGPAGGNSVLVTANPASPHTSTVLSYTYTPTGCPPVTISKTINNGTIGANVFVSRNWYLFKQDFSLWASPNISGASYSWKVWYGRLGSNLNYYTATGNYITTPRINHYLYTPYDINWELTITTNCGQKTIKGGKWSLISGNISMETAPNLSNPSTFMKADTTEFYLETRFTEADSLLYEQTVKEVIAKKFIENIKDTLAIADMIGKIRMEALEPYLYFSIDSNFIPAMAQMALNSNIELETSKVYPNPTKTSLTVEVSNKFDVNKPIEFKVLNTLGTVLTNGVLKDVIKVGKIPSGNYILELSQNLHKEHIKFIKE